MIVQFKSMFNCMSKPTLSFSYPDMFPYYTYMGVKNSFHFHHSFSQLQTMYTASAMYHSTF